jgi:hypothetical protein
MGQYDTDDLERRGACPQGNKIEAVKVARHK